MNYQPRIVDAELTQKLSAVACVLIEGPKACGKTATASQLAASQVLLDIDQSARQAARIDPSLVLEGPKPRLIDEWQTVPEIWNHVRRASDVGGEPGQFILTGSAVPTDDTTRHTGAGRVSRLRMRPLSLSELGISTQAVSMGSLLDSVDVSAPDPGTTLDDLIEYVCRGGWPATMDAPLDRAQQYTRSYLDEVRRTDIERVDGIRRDPTRVLRLIRSLARNVSTEVSAATLAADTATNENELHVDTVREYLDALERVFVIEHQPAWDAQLRSKSKLRKTPKRHFVDPSLAVAALRGNPDRLKADLNFFGFLFESLVIRDLRIYAQAHDGIVYHYRDNTGLEVDAIVENASGAWLAMEVKLGDQEYIDKAAANLLRFQEKVDTAKTGEPAKLVIVTGTGYAYERSDGVAVVPLAALTV